MSHIDCSEDDYKLNLKIEVNNLLYKFEKEILSTRQVIPWAGTRVGPCYAVPQDQVVGGFEGMKKELLALLVRKYDVKPKLEGLAVHD